MSKTRRTECLLYAVRRCLAPSAVAALLLSGLAPATTIPDSSTYYGPTILTLAADLERDYVFADMGRRYARMLRGNLAEGLYRGVTEPAEISRRLTGDLRRVHQDLHLRVRPVAFPSGTSAASTPSRLPIEDISWLAPGIAYVRFNLFPGTPQTVAATRKFMLEHAAAKAIIIDARHNHGGGGDEINVMLPYLFASRARVVDMKLSRDVAGELGFSEDRFFRKVSAPQGKVRFEQIVEPDAAEHRLFTAKVYYLTSLDTGSAAEALAFIFKISRRATLVGERTRGMDHFGKFVRIGQGLECFLPVGRTFDPASGQDWEGAGVAPDVVTSPGDALRTAMRLAESS